MASPHLTPIMIFEASTSSPLQKSLGWTPGQKLSKTPPFTKEWKSISSPTTPKNSFFSCSRKMATSSNNFTHP